MDFATLLLVMTLPNGGKIAVGGFPISAAECHTLKPAVAKDYRSIAICVHSPVWVVDWRNWRLIGNRLYYIRGDGRLELEKWSTAAASSSGATP